MADICSICTRTRTKGVEEHPNDAIDYHPDQVIRGLPLGWYSGPDGNMCPEDMARQLQRTIGRQK